MKGKWEDMCDTPLLTLKPIMPSSVLSILSSELEMGMTRMTLDDKLEDDRLSIGLGSRWLHEAERVLSPLRKPT